MRRRHASLLLLFLVVLLFFVAAVRFCAEATVLAKSELQKCSRATLKTDIQCGSKIVVELSVAAGKHADEDAIVATLDAVKNISSGELQALKDPQTIKISKSTVFMGYPLEFKKNFNRKVQELAEFTRACQAKHCLAFNDQGQQINVPEAGFCCFCTGLKKSHHRGLTPDCSLFIETAKSQFSKKVAGTRHCLGLDPQWFSTYAIGLGTMEFNITIGVFVGFDTLLSSITLTPSDIIATTEDRTVIARLHGDLVSYTQFPVFPSVYLSKPANYMRRLLNGSEWLLIDKLKYSFNGQLCDHIGTLYYAFCDQLNRCTQAFNNCLRFQIQDYIEEDYERVLKGLKPRYAVTQYGVEFDFKDEGAFTRLLLPLKDVTKSIITLELNADDVKFIINRSLGKIISVVSSKFEALSRDGIAKVVVSNIGELVAAFYLSMNCSIGIRASPELILSLQPNKPETYEFALTTTSDKASSIECVARLKDSGGEVLDKVSTMVMVTATTYINVSKFANKDIDPTESTSFISSILSSITSFLTSAFNGIASLGKRLFGNIFGPFATFFERIFSFFSSNSSSNGASCNACKIMDISCIIGSLCYGKIILILGLIIMIVGGLWMCGLMNLFRSGDMNNDDDSSDGIIN